jgi:DNA-binding CsgD family transcriptional regulator
MRRMNRGTLSPRELEALTWAAKGKTYWETAVILGVSYPSVHNYIDSLKLKLNAINVTHAVALGYELGIFELPTAETRGITVAVACVRPAGGLETTTARRD